MSDDPDQKNSDYEATEYGRKEASGKQNLFSKWLYDEASRNASTRQSKDITDADVKEAFYTIVKNSPKTKKYYRAKCYKF